MFRISLTERVEHSCSHGPVFETYQRRACVVFCGRTDLRRRRCLFDSQEMIRGRTIIALLVGLLALFVNRSREILDQRGI